MSVENHLKLVASVIHKTLILYYYYCVDKDIIFNLKKNI